jgi:hypothetical protein
MSQLDNLPPDLRAVLSLLLRQHKRHADVAAMLDIEERAVHDRAHAALALLAPREARGLSAPEREQVGEYLLGQQDAAAQSRTRAQLESSAAARTWARALAGELAPLSSRPLAHIPADPPTTAAGGPRTARPTQSQPSTSAQERPPLTTPPDPQPSSRVGGAVILGVLAAVVIVVVLLIVGIGGGSHGTTKAGSTASATGHTGSGPQRSAGTGTATSGSAGETTGTGTTGGASTTGSSQASHGKALPLTPPNPATSKAVGVAYVLTQKGQRAFYIFAKGLPSPPSGAFYAVWLEGAASAADYPLGSLPAQSSSGLVEGGGPLPSDAGVYRRILVTTETSHHPTHPGPTALGGAFSVG